MIYGDTLLERVRSLAKERGTSVFKLEESLGFGNGTISRWDKSSPSVEKLQSVARVLNVSIPFYSVMFCIPILPLCILLRKTKIPLSMRAVLIGMIFSIIHLFCLMATITC